MISTNTLGKWIKAILNFAAAAGIVTLTDTETADLTMKMVIYMSSGFTFLNGLANTLQAWNKSRKK